MLALKTEVIMGTNQGMLQPPEVGRNKEQISFWTLPREHDSAAMVLISGFWPPKLEESICVVLTHPTGNIYSSHGKLIQGPIWCLNLDY